MENHKTPDALEIRVRIVVGALVGILVGVLGGVLIVGPSSLVLVLGFVLGAAFAWLAVQVGDTFWARLGTVLRRVSWLQ
jgi:hypothetical protein